MAWAACGSAPFLGSCSSGTAGAEGAARRALLFDELAELVVMEIAFSIALFFLSIISGMLGIGVAIVAVPVLSIGLSDLVNQVHPPSLILNGVTALRR